MIRLLNRFFEPSDGRILVAGHDIKDLSLNSLRQVLGVVPQVLTNTHNQVELASVNSIVNLPETKMFFFAEL